MTPDVLDLHGAAAELDVTYDWLQRHWRTEPGFPWPHKGGGRGQSPRWARALIIAFKHGQRFPRPDQADTAAPAPGYDTHANDRHPTPPADRVAALLAAAGG
ncbi:MAG: hypothetical protein ACK4FB_08865 [Brevundimonas sp.]|uniref:hypothetical protein n=1 Tax=Brevundimonas sp. TaxID=1871086 RepID=UPI00391D922C